MAERDVKIRVNLVEGDTSDIEKLKREAENIVNTMRKGMEDLKNMQGEAKSATTGTVEASQKAVKAGEAMARVAIDGAEANKIADQAAKEYLETVRGVLETAETMEEVGAVSDELSRVWIKAREAAAGYPVELEKAADVTDKFHAQFRKVFEERQRVVEEARRAEEEAARRAEQAWRSTSAALTAGLTAGAQFLTVIRMFAGENEELEEFARKFIKIQATMQALSAGQRSLQQLANALQGMGAASTAAAAGSAAAGAAAAAATPPMAGFGAAAASAGVALNTVLPILGLISLAVVGVTTAMQFFGEDTEDAARTAERALQQIEGQLKRNTAEIRAATAEVEAQNSAYDTQLKIQSALQGGDLTVDQIKEQSEKKQDLAGKKLTAGIDELIEREVAALKKEQAEAPELTKEIRNQWGVLEDVVRDVEAEQERARKFGARRARLDRIGRSFEDANLTGGEQATLTGDLAALGDKGLSSAIKEQLVQFQSATAGALLGELSGLQRKGQEAERKRQDLDREKEQELTGFAEDELRQTKAEDFLSTADKVRFDDRLTALDASTDPNQRKDIINQLTGLTGGFFDQETREGIEKKGLGASSQDFIAGLEDALSTEEEADILQSTLENISDLRKVQTDLLKQIGEEIKKQKEELEQLESENADLSKNVLSQ